MVSNYEQLEKFFSLLFRNKCSHVCPDVVCLIGTDLSSSFTSSLLIVCMKHKRSSAERRVLPPQVMKYSAEERMLIWECLESGADVVLTPVTSARVSLWSWRQSVWAWRQHRKSTQRQTLCFIRPQQHSLTNELTNNGLMGRKKM